MSKLIPHTKARESAQRLINSHFNNKGEHGRASIPARPDYDDDLIICDYIRQQSNNDSVLRNALRIAAHTFRHYENLHRMKPDHEKADRNADFARICEGALRECDDPVVKETLTTETEKDDEETV